MDIPDDGERIHLRVEAGKPVELAAGHYSITAVVPEHLRRPGLVAYWSDVEIPIRYED